jgi:hypothetical protein
MPDKVCGSVPMSVAGAAVQFGEFAARSSLSNGFEGGRGP